MAVHGWGIFLILLFTALVVGAVVYIGYAHYRARQLGLPPPGLNPFSRRRNDTGPYRTPAPAPGGIQGWVADKWSALRTGRSSGGGGGGYESTGGGLGGGGGRRGGALDPDEAWDVRVDHETGAYYEEQELGLQDPHHGPYGGGGYGEVGIGGIEEGRGRSKSRQRELDARYDEEMHGGQRPRDPFADQGTLSQHRGGANPFGDGAEPSNISLRSVSPRPDGERGVGGGVHKKGQPSLGLDDSPSESRRSVFREDM